MYWTRVVYHFFHFLEQYFESLKCRRRNTRKKRTEEDRRRLVFGPLQNIFPTVTTNSGSEMTSR